MKMDFENQLNAIVETIAERKTLVNTEEATKMTFIMPFLKHWVMMFLTLVLLCQNIQQI